MANNLIPSDGNTTVFDALTGASAKGSSAIAYPSPLPSGVAGLVFDWTGDETLELRSESTDSYTEANYPIHDQIALKPERFTVNASTAEIVFLGPPQAFQAPSQPSNPLLLLSAMVPSLTPGSALALASRISNTLVATSLPSNTTLPANIQNALSGTAYMASLAAQTIGQEATGLYSLADQAPTLGPLLSSPLGPVAGAAGSALGGAPNSPASSSASPGVNNLWQYYKSLNGTNQTRQVLIVGYIYALWKGRQRFTVETPWGGLDSMIIESVDSTQPAETPGRTDHRITFKKFNVGPDVTVTSAVGRAANQAVESNPSTNGNVGQTDLTALATSPYYQQWTAAGQPQQLPYPVPTP